MVEFTVVYYIMGSRLVTHTQGLIHSSPRAKGYTAVGRSLQGRAGAGDGAAQCRTGIAEARARGRHELRRGATGPAGQVTVVSFELYSTASSVFPHKPISGSLSLLCGPQESAAPQTCARLSEPLAAGSSARVFAPWPRFLWRPPPPSPPSPPAPSTPLLRVLTASSSPASSPSRRRRPGREGSERRPPPLRWAASRSRARVSRDPRGPKL